MYTKEERDIITLCSFEGLSYGSQFTLLDRFESKSPDFAKYEQSLIKNVTAGVYNKVRENFYNEKYREKLFEKFKKRGITCVTYFSESYPEHLRHIDCPPVVLYCKGDVSLLKTRCLAVVGSRRTPPNVLKFCKKLSGELTEKFTIVTGMADGADSAAIEGAIESGKIISVLANGFDYCYPAVNERLIKSVAEKGLLITEYLPHIPPKAYNFPVRNRIIAGLSEGTLVVSAGKKSGALITAHYAAEYGKEVFALPYSPGTAAGEGCNALIKEGAALTEGAKDIFAAFGMQFAEPKKAELSEKETEILKIISEAGEAFAPDIAEKLGELPFKIIPLLSSLEIKGLIVRLGGNIYSVL